MIKSVDYSVLKARLGEPAFSELMATKKLKDSVLEAAVRDIVARWKKGELTNEEKDLLESPHYSSYNTWALSVGVYEEVNQSIIDTGDDNEVLEFINSVSASRLLALVTRICNVFRVKQGKVELTSDQVKARLMY